MKKIGKLHNNSAEDPGPMYNDQDLQAIETSMVMLKEVVGTSQALLYN
jgi:hypothetical protein